MYALPVNLGHYLDTAFGLMPYSRPRSLAAIIAAGPRLKERIYLLPCQGV